jgi:biofilm PGA synthesis lipoprotein PgaB
VRHLGLIAAFLTFCLLSSGCGLMKREATNEVAQTEVSAEPIKEDTQHGEVPSETDIVFEAQKQRVPILMFHDLVQERGKGTLWYDCSVEEFEAIMAEIESEGMTPISLDDLYAHLTTGADVPEKSIVLTFDDNYQSFYDLAWPILKKRNFPAAMFVHTGFVGKKEGRPKMDYATLKELCKDKLFTVGSHTINHFLDLKDRDALVQKQELEQSKQELEAELGKPMDYLAYPNGSNGWDTQLMARDAGYKMAFTIVNTPAEESPNIMAVGRYVHTKLKNAIKDAAEATEGAPAAIARIKFDLSLPVTYKKGKFAGVELKMVWGGVPSTAMSMVGREPVKAFVDREQAVAGINGGFFAMAAIQSSDNRMVGPLKTPEMTMIEPDVSAERWQKIHNRPLVIWNDEEFALLPYVPAQMNKNEQYEYFMKGYTDCFMGGVWLVHLGEPRSKELQNVFGSKDIQDYRRRAFIGMTKDGAFVAGAAVQSVSSEKLAKAIAAAGVEEAVLIDSGFSTSLVYDGKVKASGHSSKTDPSRPVPHAIVIRGTLDPTVNDDEDLKAATDEPSGTKKRRRKQK